MWPTQRLHCHAKPRTRSSTLPLLLQARRLLLLRANKRPRGRWLLCAVPGWALLLLLLVLLAVCSTYRHRHQHHTRAQDVVFAHGTRQQDDAGVVAPHHSISLCDALGAVGPNFTGNAKAAAGVGAAVARTRRNVARDGSARPLKLLLALVIDPKSTGKLGRAAACAEAAAAAHMLRKTQTWFQLVAHDGPTQFATIVAASGQGASSSEQAAVATQERLAPCPGAIEWPSSSPSLKTRRVDYYDFVLFVDASFLARHRVQLHATAIEKMVLAASSDPHVAVVTLHPSSSLVLRSLQRRVSGGGVCVDSSTPYVRRQTCHFDGSPLLVRAPSAWLGAHESSTVWTDAVSGLLTRFAETRVPGGRSGDALRSSTSPFVTGDLLAPFFCSAVDGNALKVRALTELEHLVSQDDLVVALSAPLSSSGEPSSSSSPSSSVPLRSCASIVAGAPSPRPSADAEDWRRVVRASFGRKSDPSAVGYRHVQASTFAPLDRPGFMLIVPWLEHGGADQFNVNLARRLTDLGVRVVVVTTEKSTRHPIARTFYAITPDVFHLDQLVSSSSPTISGENAALAALGHLVATRNVQAVMISHSAYGYAVLPRLRAHLRRRQGLASVSFVDYVHLVELEWGDGGYAAVSADNTQYLDHTFAASRQVAEWMQVRRRQAARGAGDGGSSKSATATSSAQSQDSRTSVAYIGVDTRALRPLPDAERERARAQILMSSQAWAAHKGTGVVIIAYIARMVDQKLPDVYFEIVRRLRLERHVEFVSLAIGDGDRLGELRANLSRHPVLQQSVRTYGMLDHNASMRLLAASDILLLPSRNEGVSLAVYEAMALGVFPVVSAVGGQCELVADGAGACIPFELADATTSSPDEAMLAATTPFVDELERLIVKSPHLLSEGRRAARARVVRDFSLDHLIKGLHRGLCVAAAQSLN